MQCDKCDFNFFLLSVNAITDVDTSTLDTVPSQEGQLSMCISKCEDFAYNYVSNLDTMKCEYCGATCTHCTIRDGCLSDHAVDHGYKWNYELDPGTEEIVDNSIVYPSGDFPFSAATPTD